MSSTYSSQNADSAGRDRARKKNSGLSRSEKALRIREDLLHAAGQVIGEQGYLNAMIQAITSRAGVANGTFYNYFSSRQELFDQLLPLLGREMLMFIAERSTDADDEIEREVDRFRAFFDYLNSHPEFYRVLYEGEVFAQDAFDAHMKQVIKGFGGILRRAANAGELTGYSSHEVDVLALILMGARHYMAMYYLRQGGGGSIPDWSINTYRKFIMGGLRAVAEDEA